MNRNAPSFAYIHGFNSDKNSRSYKDVKALLGTVYDFYYNYRQEAKFAYREIEEKLLDAYNENPNLILIGSSLGGFFTLHFAGKYALPCVVFNPVTFPHEQLAPFTGKNHNFYTNEEWDFTKELLMSYKEFPLSTKMNYMPTIVLGTNDDVISPDITLSFWKNKANILITTNEHSINNYKDYAALFLRAACCYNNSCTYFQK